MHTFRVIRRVPLAWCVGSFALVIACGGTDFTAAPADGGAARSGGAGKDSGADRPNEGSGSGGHDSASSDVGSDMAVASDARDDAPKDAPGDGVVSCDAALKFYRDNDGDNAGQDDTTELACMKPAGFAVEGGDCNDLLADVFPKQTSFFANGYAAGASVSFDYNCSRTEEPDTSQLGAAVPQCPGLLANCGSAVPGFKSTGRSGPGVNGLCGSTIIVRCVSNGLVCGPVEEQAPAKRCH